MNIPAVSGITDFSKVRLALVYNGHIVSAPLEQVFQAFLGGLNGQGLLLSGDMQASGFDRLLLEGDQSGDLLLE